MKKTRLQVKQLFLILLCLFFNLCCAPVADADSILQRGDYVIFGKFQGETMGWRVYRTTEDSVVLIADKAVETMAFDSFDGNWATSELRTWLNSRDGFLSDENFNEAERGLFNEFSRNIAVNESFAGNNSMGSEEHIYNSSISYAVQNYSVAFSINTADGVFLPTSAEISDIYSDPYSFGVDYYMTELIFSPGSYCSYWLSDGMYGLDSSFVRCVTSDGYAGYEPAQSVGIGVRPMCSLSSSKIGIFSGNGSSEEPYVIGDNDYLAIVPEFTSVWSGTEVKVRVYGKDTTNGPVVLYRNNEIFSSAGGNEASFIAEDGVNVITAYVYDLSGKPVLISSPVSVYGLNTKVKKTNWDCSFEESNPFAEPNTSGITWSADGGKNGKGVTIVSAPNTQSTLNSISVDKKAKTLLVDVDIRFNTLGVLTNYPFRFKVLPSDEFVMPVAIDPGGNVFLNGVEESSGNLKRLNEGEWYNFRLLISEETNAISFAIDDVVLCRDVKLSDDFDYSAYMIISASWNNTEFDNSISVDNLKVCAVDFVEKGIELSYIVHPDSVSITTFASNDTGNDYCGNIVAAGYHSSLLMSESFASRIELPAYGFAVKDFTFDNSCLGRGYYRVFAFEDNLRPLTKDTFDD